MFRLRTLLITALVELILIPTAFASSGDLSVSAPWLSDDFVTQGELITVTVSAINNSTADLLGSVRITANDETINGDQPISALAGSTDEVFISWQPQNYGSYTLTATIIPWDDSADDSSNNTSSITVFVEQDTDYDGIPNTQDDDMDGDGVNNDEDAFPLDGNEITDTDGDGTGDNQDTDDDNDGVLDENDDLPLDPLYSSDQDGDGIPDENDDDIDGDGLSNDSELVIGTDPNNVDSDGDATNDGDDAFPLDENEITDTDGDGVGDREDNDIDGDGVVNDSDADPLNQTPEADTDQDIYLTGIDDEVIFSASESDDPDGNITDYVWQFADGTLLYGEEVSKSFSATGLQAAILTVTDDTGQVDSTEIKIRVLDYQFLFWAILFALLLILLAFYTIHRYNRRAPKKTK